MKNEDKALFLPNEVQIEFEKTYLACTSLEKVMGTVCPESVDGVIVLFKELIRHPERRKDMAELQTVILRNLYPGNYGVIDTSVRKTNVKYGLKELQWYLSQDLDSTFIAQEASIWTEISGDDHTVNSNYGWCIFSNENGSQYDNALSAIEKDRHTRHGSMIYTRPSMHRDAFENNKSDFVCTCYVQLMLDPLEDGYSYNVHMRSNDFIFGFFNDFFWHAFVARSIHRRLRKPVRINWIADSLHVYHRHYHLFTK